MLCYGNGLLSLIITCLNRYVILWILYSSHSMYSHNSQNFLIVTTKARWKFIITLHSKYICTFNIFSLSVSLSLRPIFFKVLVYNLFYLLMAKPLLIYMGTQPGVISHNLIDIIWLEILFPLLVNWHIIRFDIICWFLVISLYISLPFKLCVCL